MMFRTSNLHFGAGLKLAWVSLVCVGWWEFGADLSMAAESRGPGPATVAKPSKRSEFMSIMCVLGMVRQTASSGNHSNG
jgi:hypothetical protein